MENFNKLINKQFQKLCKTGKLFRVEVSGKDLWDTYLNAFLPEDNLIFRDPESSEHNCNHCNNFIRRYGNVVAIDEGFNIISMFDFIVEGEYQKPAQLLAEAIKSSKIKDVFFETFEELKNLPYEKCTKENSLFRLGIENNIKVYSEAEVAAYGTVEPDKVYKFSHFFLDLPKAYVDTSGDSIPTIMESYRSSAEVFERGMREISLDSLNLVKDLIAQGSLLDGTAHLFKLDAIIPLKEVYDTLPQNKKHSWCWYTSYNLSLAKFKNELLGVLCSDLSEGKEINVACQEWNKRVDPINYMKATAPITTRQKAMAQTFVEENGYEKSFNRRHAVLSDIKISEILHANSTKDTLNKPSIFDNVKTKSTQFKKSEFKGIEEVSISKFMVDILPTCASVEVYLENRHQNNLHFPHIQNHKHSSLQKRKVDSQNR